MKAEPSEKEATNGSSLEEADTDWKQHTSEEGQRLVVGRGTQYKNIETLGVAHLNCGPSDIILVKIELR